jgi:hypothetical protein
VRPRGALRAHVAGVALLLGLAGGVRAQGEGSNAASTPVPKDPIAEARKDFESLKSAREAALLPGSRMPQVGVPELSLPSAGPNPGGGPTTKPLRQETKSANWLVDAMEKETNSKANRKKDLRSRDRKSRSGSRETDNLGLDRKSGAGEEGRELLTPSERAQRDERDEDSAPTVVNPLNSFLGEWMTPQDYALLKPGLTPSAEFGTLPITSSVGAFGGSVVAGQARDSTFLNSARPPTTLPPTPRENPYLQSLRPEIPVSSSPPRIRATETPPIASRPAPTMAPEPVDVPAPRIPEFAKPATDDRYFKQLKRF